jgi:hypothetical protein
MWKKSRQITNNGHLGGMQLKQTVVKWLLPVLAFFNFLAGLLLLLLGGQYLHSMYELIDIPPPRWIGWFVDDLFGLGMSAASSQLVAWAMAILGCIMTITSIDYLRIKYKP